MQEKKHKGKTENRVHNSCAKIRVSKKMASRRSLTYKPAQNIHRIFHSLECGSFQTPDSSSFLTPSLSDLDVSNVDATDKGRATGSPFVNIEAIARDTGDIICHNFHGYRH